MVVLVVAVLDTVFVCGVAIRTVFRGVTVVVRTRCDVVPWRIVVGVFDERDTATPFVVINAQKTKIIPILFIS